MSDFMPAPKNGSRFEFRTIAEMISAFEHLKRVLMGVMLEPRNSKRPLFGRIFQPLIDALRVDGYEHPLGLLSYLSTSLYESATIWQWNGRSKLYSNENNEHLPYEDFLALNEAALTIPVTEWLYLGRNQPLIPRQNKTRSRENTSSTRRPTTRSSA